MLLAHEKRQLDLSDQTIETLVETLKRIRDVVWNGFFKSLHAELLRQRLWRELQSMDNRMLDDIGINRGDINTFVDRSYRGM